MCHLQINVDPEKVIIKCVVSSQTTTVGVTPLVRRHDSVVFAPRGFTFPTVCPKWTKSLRSPLENYQSLPFTKFILFRDKNGLGEEKNTE